MSNKLLILICMILISSCKKQEARRPVQIKSHTSMASTADQMREINRIEEKKIEAYIQRDSLVNYELNSQGFWHTILFESEETRYPKEGEVVTYELEIKDLNNQILYAKDELGVQRYTVDKQDLITGLQEGLKLMNTGDEFKFLIPSYNAYGLLGNRDKIGRNQSIIAIVKLLNIK